MVYLGMACGLADFAAIMHCTAAGMHVYATPLSLYDGCTCLVSVSVLLSRVGTVLFVQGKASSDSMRMARACIINQVLGTDMKKHFDIVSRFQVLVNAGS